MNTTRNILIFVHLFFLEIVSFGQSRNVGLLHTDFSILEGKSTQQDFFIHIDSTEKITVRLVNSVINLQYG